MRQLTLWPHHWDAREASVAFDFSHAALDGNIPDHVINPLVMTALQDLIRMPRARVAKLQRAVARIAVTARLVV